MPKHICEKCEIGLRFSYRLRKQSEETEKRLRQEMQLQSNSTPIGILDGFSSNDVDGYTQTADVMSYTSLISEININTSTTTKESDCLFTEENHMQDVIASTTLCMEIKKHQNIVEILDEDALSELSYEERLRLNLLKRGVFLLKRSVPLQNTPLKEISKRKEVIAEKRIQLDFDTCTDVFSGTEFPPNKCLNILNNEINEVNEEDDIIEVIDDDSTPELPNLALSSEDICETLNSYEYQDKEFIEEIPSSDEEDRTSNKCIGEQADVVYEESIDGIDESISIDDCQIHFTKEESNGFVGHEYVVENETVKTQDVERDVSTIDVDGGTHSNTSTTKKVSST